MAAVVRRGSARSPGSVTERQRWVVVVEVLVMEVLVMEVLVVEVLVEVLVVEVTPVS